MSNRYGANYRGGNGYGNFGPPQQMPSPQQQRQQAPPQQASQQAPQPPLQPPARLRPSAGDDYDPYGDGYSSSDKYLSSSSRERSRGPPPRAARRSPYGSEEKTANQSNQSLQSNQSNQSSQSNKALQPNQPVASAPPPLQPPPRRRPERQIGQDALDHIRAEWPVMCENDCVPVQMALQLLDSSSVGRAHEYQGFQATHQYLQNSLKGIVHDYHQGFNSSIGTFHKIQSSIQASQKKVRGLKETLGAAKTSLCKTDPELRKLYASSQMYDDVLQTLNDLDELRQVPERLEARISEKQFLTAVDVLQGALLKLRKPELDGIGALSDLRSYLANQETALMDILVEELHEHMYLKSPYCQERWQALAKNQGLPGGEAYYGEGESVEAAGGSGVTPFYALLDGMEFAQAVQEDPGRNPERDTFYYISLVVESLNRLGRLEAAVDQLKQRLPVELFGVVNETVTEVDRKHPSSLRGGGGAAASANGLHIYGSRETQMRADVLYDLLWTLYGKFEAIAEGHRVLHEYIKALIRREGAGNNSALLGSFKELWNLYQNEIRSLLHNYVTTDADLYRFSHSPLAGGGFGRGGGGGGGTGRDGLFKFAEADARSVEMAAEYEALDGIIRTAVPGLTSEGGSGGSKKGDKKIGGRKSVGGFGEAGGGSGGAASQQQQDGVSKPLVEPSVFNMSLLLPPTLVFLQRLKSIVPPGSDLATSTLTSFLDNFLVNVFQPQLDETLGKLCDGVFGVAGAFQADAQWSQVARQPVFKGTTAFFSVVTAFCRMLGTIPHDQALSALMITQMMRYYDRCFSWYKALVTRGGEDGGSGGGNSSSEDGSAEGSVTSDSDLARLRMSAVLALEDGDVAATAKQLWAATTEAEQTQLLGQEVTLLLGRANRRGTAGRLVAADVIADRDAITSLCLLYTSMKWLAVKIGGLRHITQQEGGSGGGAASSAGATASAGASSARARRRWTLLNDGGKALAEAGAGPVYLPMTQETVQTFDGIVSSYEELATTALLTLHLEVRCRIAYALGVAMSPATAPYLLDQDVREPDPQVLALNAALLAYDETATRLLRAREAAFVRRGLGRLVSAYLVGNARMATPMNGRGCGRMQLNILVLQQNLKNVEAGVDLARAANYYALFEGGADAILAKARAEKEKGEKKAEEEKEGEKKEESTDKDGSDEGGANADADADADADANTFSYDELKELMELVYSEQLANPERGIENAARRQMGEKLMELGEQMWQM